MAMTDKQTVLVVEDDPLIREIMHDVLEDEGFHALCADCTQEAIETIQHDHGDGITAIFADIDLGDRGGGYEVARCARSVKPDIKIIYTSGGAREDFMKERVEGAIFVQKPYVPSQVCQLLRQKPPE
jgi:CheY-like chemotaxis protein